MFAVLEKSGETVGNQLDQVCVGSWAADLLL